MAPANTQTIGKAFIVYGTVKAVSPAGVERLLTPNSPVYAHERIVTGPDGSVSIALADQQGHLDLGRMSDVLMDEDVYGGGHPGGADAIAQVTDIQAALQDGTIDPTTDLPAPAAGPGTGGAPGARGGGRQVVVFESDHMQVTPDSGAETSGVGLNFLDPPPGGRPEESPAIPGEGPIIDPSIPLIGHAELTFDEANLPLGTHPVAGSQTQGGTLADLGVHFGNGGPGTLDFGNGQTITIDGSNTSLTVEGKYGDLTINGDGTWTYTLDGNTLDHTGKGATGTADQVGDQFSFGAIDSNGNRADGGSVVVHILDDGPTLDVGNQEVDESNGLGQGHEVNGTLNFNFGADQAGSSLTLSAEGATWDANAKTLTGADNAWTLHVNNDGTYTFTQLQAMDHLNSSDPNDPLDIKITAVVTDGDGDSISKDFTVTVYDDGPSLKVGDQTVDETGPSHTVDGTLEFNFGADQSGSSLTLSAEGATWDALTQTLTG
ncbi:MAG: retention module-containing protein, partial [Desulfobulbus sp.]|uniref:retention module-containing protein n=1 Tax=Desulfobulbus sp. TaxID=895 RepID=UPI00283B9AD2